MAKKSLQEQLEMAKLGSDLPDEGDYQALVDGKEKAKPSPLEAYKAEEKAKLKEVEETPPVQEKTPEPVKAPAREEKKEPPQRLSSFGSSKALPAVSASFLDGVIHMTDELRSLDAQKTKSLHAFLQIDSEEQGEGDIVYALLQSEERRATALIDLVNLYREDGVSRAFSLMALSDLRLDNLSNIVTIFSNKEDYTAKDLRTERIEFCRSLQEAIANFPSSILDNLESIAKILELALEVKKT